jgi:hypothetical protein
MGLGMAAVLAGDLARAEAHRLRAETHRKSFRLVDVAADRDAARRLREPPRRAGLRARMRAAHFEVSDEAGIQWQAHNALLHSRATWPMKPVSATRRRDHAPRSSHGRRDGVRALPYQSDLLDAYRALSRATARRCASRSRRASRAGAWTAPSCSCACSHAPPAPLAAALEEGIEVEAVQRDIRVCQVAPPDANVEHGHWPLAVHTLGRFEVRRDGMPLEFSRKAPRKTLALLKAIVALGGTDVREQSLLDALWPDDEGDAAAKSLGATVLRLRALLGMPKRFAQQAGTLSLDPARIWVDAWAFERGRRLDLYKGAFLAQDEGEPWAVAMRERLRARFIHEVGDQGAALERAGRPADAVELYLRGLDADSIVEPFYRA